MVVQVTPAGLEMEEGHKREESSGRNRKTVRLREKDGGRRKT